MRIVGGIWAGRPLTSPGRRVRPTQEDVRDALMALLGDRLHGARVLDLFAGTGALGLEALSRGAASADFVEFGGEALHALKANVAARKLRPLARGERPSAAHKAARIFKRDALPFAAGLPAGAYDLAFADPPYGSLKLDRVVQAWQRVPFAPVLCAEHAPDHALPAGAHTLRFEACAVTVYGL
ncbi:MAG: RsmD family RNA methyltransferase [Myxococcales bacterium]|nr:RsmD family RNA methyltransferase [Myxococcales bacterium]